MSEEDPNDEEQAFFNFKDGDYIVGIWYVDLPPFHTGFGKIGPYGFGGNMLGMLYRRQAEPAVWHFDYRFRNYRDNRVFDSRDSLQGFKGEIRDLDEATVKGNTDRFFNTAAGVIHARVEYLDVSGGPDEFFAKIEREKPAWMHMGGNVGEVRTEVGDGRHL